MAAVEAGTVRTEFLYDGYRRRSSEITTVGSNIDERVTVWCGTVECEQRDLTTSTRFYSRGEHSGGAARLLVADHLGSTASVTDSTGANLTSFTYDPWGRTSVTSGTPWEQKGFTGRRGSAAAETWAMVYRDYDPSLGRWLSEDPIGFEGGINLYSYVEAGPTTAIDPSGLIAVNVQPLKINYTPRARVPGGACGSTNQIRSFTGQCQCTPGGYKPTLEVSYKPEMWIAVDANIPPDVIQQHEWRHYQDGLSAIQEAIADGSALEQKTFGSNGACLAAIDRWALKSSRRFTTSSMWFHFWERTKFWRTTCSRQ